MQMEGHGAASTYQTQLPNPEIWLPNPWSVTLTVICDIDKKIFNSSHHLIHNLSLISPFDIFDRLALHFIQIYMIIFIVRMIFQITYLKYDYQSWKAPAQ